MAQNEKVEKIERRFWMKNNCSQFHPYFYLLSGEDVFKPSCHVKAHTHTTAELTDWRVAFWKAFLKDTHAPSWQLLTKWMRKMSTDCLNVINVIGGLFITVRDKPQTNTRGLAEQIPTISDLERVKMQLINLNVRACICVCILGRDYARHKWLTAILHSMAQSAKQMAECQTNRWTGTSYLQP